MVQRADGALVRDPAEVADEERLSVRLAGGRLPVRVDRATGDRATGDLAPTDRLAPADTEDER